MPASPSRILFVCLGNICRSPAAEGVFRVLCPDVESDSAGTAGYHVGEPPYGPMQAALGARGFDVSELRARQFKVEDFDRFGLIVAMDHSNLEDIEVLRPAGNRVPLRLFTDFAPETGADHVPDPYYTRDFDGCIDLIERAAAGLKLQLE